MRLLVGVLALLVLVPVAEIGVIVWVGHAIGAGATALALLLAALIGVWLVRREGARAWRALRAANAAGRPPAVESAEGALVLFGGLLLVLPGFLSDVVGLALIIRPVRSAVAQFAVRRFARQLPPEVGSLLVGPLSVRSHRVRPGRFAKWRSDRSQQTVTPPSAAPSSPGPRQEQIVVIEGTIEDGPRST